MAFRPREALASLRGGTKVPPRLKPALHGITSCWWVSGERAAAGFSRQSRLGLSFRDEY